MAADVAVLIWASISKYYLFFPIFFSFETESCYAITNWSQTGDRLALASQMLGLQVRHHSQLG